MRRASRLAIVPVALALLVAACGDDGDSDDTTTTTDTETSVPAPDGIEVGVGINDPEDANVAVLEFLPEEVSVEVGTDVTWQWQGTEPHSVTFLSPGQELPPPGDPSVFEPTAADTTSYDGTSFVNTGLLPLSPEAPPPFTMSFASAGDYSYYCVIHPAMVGQVTVTEAGGDVDTPADVAERRADETEQFLEEGRAVKEELASADPVTVKNDDGSTTWTIEMGATTEHVDVLAFAPTPAGIKAGDTVKFVNNSGAPHTASFFGEGAEPITSPLDPRTDAPAPGPSPQTLASAGFFNTGLLPPDAPPGAGPPEAARSFEFKVPDAGSYAYVCILHAPSEMVGTITAS
ncbi:MAG: plastocyanin/azurin family copper-binding protein [Actinomycetota bacterium]|nr:plastocyanin/azurin family copper-binding protein [Actinomycetota bacterium]